MAEVPREIMNHLRAKLYHDRHNAVRQPTSSQGENLEVAELTASEPSTRLERAAGKLASRSTLPELSGD